MTLSESHRYQQIYSDWRDILSLISGHLAFLHRVYEDQNEVLVPISHPPNTWNYREVDSDECNQTMQGPVRIYL